MVPLKSPKFALQQNARHNQEFTQNGKMVLKRLGRSNHLSVKISIWDIFELVIDAIISEINTDSTNSTEVILWDDLLKLLHQEAYIRRQMLHLTHKEAVNQRYQLEPQDVQFFREHKAI